MATPDSLQLPGEPGRSKWKMILTTKHAKNAKEDDLNLNCGRGAVETRILESS